MDRKDEMKKLYESGLTYRAVADRFGVSRARAHQIISGYHPIDRSIRYKVLQLFGEFCMICSSTTKLNIHHIDGNSFNNSLENLSVVCSACHANIHRIQGDSKNRRKYTKKRIDFICIWCKKESKILPCLLKRKFCSRNCQLLHWKKNSQSIEERKAKAIKRTTEWYNKHKNDKGFKEKVKERNLRYYYRKL